MGKKGKQPSKQPAAESVFVGTGSLASDALGSISFDVSAGVFKKVDKFLGASARRHVRASIMVTHRKTGNFARLAFVEPDDFEEGKVYFKFAKLARDRRRRDALSWYRQKARTYDLSIYPELCITWSLTSNDDPGGTSKVVMDFEMCMPDDKEK